MQKARMAAMALCRAYMRRDRRRYTSLRQSSMYVLFSHILRRVFLFTRASIDVGKDSEKQLWKHRFIHAFHASFWSGAHPTYAIPIHSSVPPVDEHLLLFVYRQRCGEDRAPIGF